MTDPTPRPDAAADVLATIERKALSLLAGTTPGRIDVHRCDADSGTIDYQLQRAPGTPATVLGYATDSDGSSRAKADATLWAHAHEMTTAVLTLAAEVRRLTAALAPRSAADLAAIEARAAYTSAQFVADDDAVAAGDTAPDTWRVVCEHWSTCTATIEHRADRVVATLNDGRWGQGPTPRLAVLAAAKGEAITEVLAPGKLSRADLLRPVARACRDLRCDAADLPGEVHRLIGEVEEIPTHVKVLSEAHARELAATRERHAAEVAAARAEALREAEDALRSRAENLRRYASDASERGDDRDAAEYTHDAREVDACAAIVGNVAALATKGAPDV